MCQITEQYLLPHSMLSVGSSPLWTSQFFLPNGAFWFSGFFMENLNKTTLSWRLSEICHKSPEVLRCHKTNTAAGKKGSNAIDVSGAGMWCRHQTTAFISCLYFLHLSFSASHFSAEAYPLWRWLVFIVLSWKSNNDGLSVLQFLPQPLTNFIRCSCCLQKSWELMLQLICKNFIRFFQLTKQHCKNLNASGCLQIF